MFGFTTFPLFFATLILMHLRNTALLKPPLILLGSLLTDLKFLPLVVVSTLFLCLAIGGLALDRRLINGDLCWLKLFRFSASLIVYGLTLGWMARFVKDGAPTFKWLSPMLSVSGFFELSIIAITSLLSLSSLTGSEVAPLLNVLSVASKVAIAPISAAALIMFRLVLRQKELPAVVGQSLRWGLILCIVGFTPGVMMMFKPTSQLLKLAHFAGLHGLQLLPILGMVLQSLPKAQVSQTIKRRILHTSGLIYLLALLALSVAAIITAH